MGWENIDILFKDKEYPPSKKKFKPVEELNLEKDKNKAHVKYRRNMKDDVKAFLLSNYMGKKYTRNEIADKLMLSQENFNYYFNVLNKELKKEGYIIKNWREGTASYWLIEEGV